MSDYTDRILTRLEALISGAPRYLLNRSLDDQTAQAVCIGWMTSASNLIETIVPDPDSGYRQLVKDRQEQAAKNPWQCHTFAAQIVEALRQLQRDAKAGLLGGIESRVSVETFDDLLDHAEEYLKDGCRKSRKRLAWH